MVLDLIAAYLMSPEYVVLLILAWALAFLAFVQWRETAKVVWIYIHIALLLTPLVHFGTTIQCSMSVIPALMSFCGDYMTKFSLLTLPFVVGASILLGFVVIPALYKRKLRAQPFSSRALQGAAQKAGMKLPQTFIVDTQKPEAFSIKQNIFLSVGLYDLLAPKELEAVFLHELGHIHSGTHARKISSWILSLFSPLAAFSPVQHQVIKEEQYADAFAARVQKTNQFLMSAKKKIRSYHFSKQMFKR